MLPKRIKFHLHNKNVIEIELLQNPFVEVWYSAFLKNIDVPRWQYATNLYQHDGSHKPCTDSAWVDGINQAISDIERLSDREWIGKAYRGMGWADVNKLHRGFTTTVVTDGLTPELPSDVRKAIKQMKCDQYICHYELREFIHRQELPDFYRFGNRKTAIWPEFHDALQRLNSFIHRYEGEFLRSTRAWDLEGPPNAFTIDLMDKYHDGSYIQDISVNQITNEMMEYSFNGYEYNVYAEKKILGKDYYTAYFQFDDPQEWDITNNMDIDGSILIDYNNAFKAIHDHWEFQEWITHYGIEDQKKYSAYQIGRLVENEFAQNMRDFQLQNVKDPDNIDVPFAIDPMWKIEQIEIVE